MIYINGDTPKPAKNSGHGLIGVLHRSFIAHNYEELFYTTDLTSEEIQQTTYDRFKEKFPDVECTLDQFKRFASNQGICLRYPLENEKIRDELMSLIEQYYSLGNVYKIAKTVYGIVNQDRKRAAMGYLKELVKEYYRCHQVKIIEDKDFDKEWLPEYDELLLHCYYHERYCLVSHPEKYLDEFLFKCGKSFSRRLVKIRLLDILPPAEQPKSLDDSESIPTEMIKLVKDNVTAFLKRRLNYSEIARKIQFLFRVEGIDMTIDDVNNLLKKLNFTTEHHEEISV